MTSLGIDVGSARKGYDLVLLDTVRRVIDTKRHATLQDISTQIQQYRPDVVAIDSPPGWAIEKTRATEAAVLGLGLQLYRTPWAIEMQANRFYAWMLHGFAAFDAARVAGYPQFDGGNIDGHTLEVFPHATATVLNGHKRPLNIDKHVWRREALAGHGVDTAQLKGNDQVDAALCALTGLLALEGCFCWQGDPAEGVIVLPCVASELRARLPWASARALAIMAEFR